jgi:hypothetical protein
MAIKRAAKLYTGFREKAPRTAKSVTVKLPKAVMVMGYLEALEYGTTMAGKARRFRHKFAAGSRALLCAGPDKNQLFIIGGRFHVTDRGIVDLTAKGKELED